MSFAVIDAFTVDWTRIIAEKTMQRLSALRSIPLSDRPAGSGMFLSLFLFRIIDE